MKKKKKKNSTDFYFFFFNDGQTENPDLDAPHLYVGPTDASLSFTFFFLVCILTSASLSAQEQRLCLLLWFLRGCSRLG